MIKKNPKIRGGRYFIKGTGVSVSTILNVLASGKNEKQVLTQARKMGIPLRQEHIKEALGHAAKKIK